MVLPWAAFADNFVNNLDTTPDPTLESATIATGGSVTIGFYIVGTTGGGDAPGCNATGNEPAYLTVSPPSGVSVTWAGYPSPLEFVGCGPTAYRNVTFSSSTSGSYTINGFSLTGGKSNSQWNYSTAYFTLNVTSPDTTPPVITPSVSGTLGNNGWYVSDVTVSWTVTDPDSAITSKVGCDPTTIDYDTTGVTLTCTATSAGGTSSESVTIKRDATPPTISATLDKSPASSGWFNASTGAPTVSFDCSDATSGLAGDCPAGFTFPEGENQSYSQTISDNAGNSASAGVSDIDVDLTAPVFGTCPVGGPFLLNSGLQPVGPISVDAAISGLDGGASTLSGFVDTSSIGTKSVTFTAVDNAGNLGTKACSYSVIYNWTGFFRPVDNLPTFNQVKAGSAIPVKFSLSGNQGLNIFAAGYPRSAVIPCDSTAPVDAVEETVTAGNSSLSYDPLADQYVYVWKTEKAWTGCRQLVVKLNDDMSYRASFKFK
jgi:hypothetical protein